MKQEICRQLLSRFGSIWGLSFMIQRKLDTPDIWDWFLSHILCCFPGGWFLALYLFYPRGGIVFALRLSIPRWPAAYLAKPRE
jgi:hypothetical protein